MPKKQADIPASLRCTCKPRRKNNLLKNTTMGRRWLICNVCLGFIRRVLPHELVKAADLNRLATNGGLTNKPHNIKININLAQQAHTTTQMERIRQLLNEVDLKKGTS